MPSPAREKGNLTQYTTAHKNGNDATVTLGPPPLIRTDGITTYLLVLASYATVVLQLTAYIAHMV